MFIFHLYFFKFAIISNIFFISSHYFSQSRWQKLLGLFAGERDWFGSGATKRREYE